ncbi:pyridoxal-phosphate dependent enzyme [Lacibacter luteus]|uniref:Pyridoxal-phosphate dependent enzyme n=1 Tax=Lacibacter luteus TaxID=2508719 RepID=A0A4Q1CFM1_9BACT|nr:pyridoxal-phosphate dependent enzyme [Lacibacter luteus]RXK58804.1 pyridoxal-phosphate dependent enzyme [Lacibacter luteus]
MQTIPLTIAYHNIKWPLENGLFFPFTVARLDLLHPVISGNKSFKLKYNLLKVLEEKKEGIITMGGAYSNHLCATAFACYQQGLSSVGIIRGEVMEPLNNTLAFCKAHGMQLLPVNRADYDSYSKAVNFIKEQYRHLLFVPEGGNNYEGFLGCTEILAAVPEADSYTHILCSMGTGTTFKGIAAAAKAHQTVIGIPALKIKETEQELFLQQHAHVKTEATTKVLFQFAGAGYARTTQEQFNFMNLFYTKTGIPTDIVYTGKLMQAVTALAEQSFFYESCSVLLIHSGGLQGNNSLPAGTLLF